MSTDSKPSIELYMYSLNQEFPVGKGHEFYLKRFSELQQDLSGSLVEQAQVESQVFRVHSKASSKIPADWRAQWLENRWIENYTKRAGVGRIAKMEPMRTAIMRKEDFGAIVFEPRSDRVYKLNKAGAKLFGALQEAYLEKEDLLEIKAMAGFKQQKVGEFVDMLKACGLWTIS